MVKRTCDSYNTVRYMTLKAFKAVVRLMIGVFKQVHFKASKPLNQTLISFELALSSHPSFRVIAAIKTWTLHFSSTLDENSLAA